jgi:ATP-dependent DNA ligase
MLAHKYVPQKVAYPCHVQPKLNGVRGIFIPGKHFQSRYGEIWTDSVVSHALSALSSVRFCLDGEFYCHGMSLQNINSRIGVVRNSPHPESTRIQFHVFDVMLDVPFWKRAEVLKALALQLEGSPSIQFVPTCIVASHIEADYLYKYYKQAGYEGLMYRSSDARYGFAQRCGNKENRWNYILKRKEMIDLTAAIIGFKEMVDDKTGLPKDTLGAFELITDDGHVFSAGSGLTNEQRDHYWHLGLEALKGVNVRILYEMRSDGGIPLKPVIDLVDTIL